MCRVALMKLVIKIVNYLEEEQIMKTRIMKQQLLKYSVKHINCKYFFNSKAILYSHLGVRVRLIPTNF